MNKIYKGDQVIIKTGKDKGKSGVVLSIIKDRLIIEGINNVKKHVKPNPKKGIEGGLEIKKMPLHISNVALIDENGKHSKVGIKFNNNGKKKVRFLKSTNLTLERS